MPCWEVQRMSVEFRADNRTLLEDAIRALGWGIVDSTATSLTLHANGYELRLNLTTGQASIADVPEAQQRLNSLKRAYSRQAIQAAARRQGWRVKETGHNAGTILKQTW